jgi:hypothetical protein
VPINTLRLPMIIRINNATAWNVVTNQAASINSSGQSISSSKRCQHSLHIETISKINPFKIESNLKDLFLCNLKLQLRVDLLILKLRDIT